MDQTNALVLMGIHKNKCSFILFTNFSLDFTRTMFKFALLVMSLALLALDQLIINVFFLYKNFYLYFFIGNSCPTASNRVTTPTSNTCPCLDK
jgi:hypothetical protein